MVTTGDDGGQEYLSPLAEEIGGEKLRWAKELEERRQELDRLSGQGGDDVE